MVLLCWAGGRVGFASRSQKNMFLFFQLCIDVSMVVCERALSGFVKLRAKRHEIDFKGWARDAVNVIGLSTSS